VESFASERPSWAIQPLVDAGVDLELIRVLMYRLGFEAIVRDGGSLAACLTNLVSDQPTNVRAAWTETIARLIGLQQAAR
jgi:hypothetical protein